VRYGLGYQDAVVGTGMLSFIKLGSQAGEAGDTKTAKQLIAEHDVVVFSSPSCPYCKQAAAALDQADIAHTVVNRTPAMRDELTAMSGATSVPMVWVKGQFIGGCNDGPESWMGVKPCIASGKIEELLK